MKRVDFDVMICQISDNQASTIKYCCLALIIKNYQIFIQSSVLLGVLNSTAIPTAVSSLSACEFSVRFTYNCLEPIDITLCLSNDPAACSNTLQCPVLGVYAATDINIVKNTILASTPTHT